MGCISSKYTKYPPGYEDPIFLASETTFTVSEVEALYELFKKLSFAIVKDGLIHKIFGLFDAKKKGAIGFGDFVRALSIFHPNTPKSEKAAFAFQLYDLRHTGSIERVELKEMVLALLSESDLQLSEDIVEAIVDNTFKQADSNGDGKIDEEEWKEFVHKNPAILKNMTLPYLIDITMAFPSFVIHSETNDADIII